MITELLLNVLMGPFFYLIELIPDINVSVPADVLNGILTFFDLAGYFLPMDTVCTVLLISVIIHNFRIGVSFLKTIWQLIPIL